MKLRKLIAGCLTLSLMSFTLVGCGSNNNSSNAGSDNVEPTKEAESQEVQKVDLTVWGPQEDQAAIGDYSEGILKAMCDKFIELGYDITTGGTDNHLFLLDFSKTHPNLTGKMVQDELDKHHITLNKNCVPNEKRSPVQSSGVRIGTAAMTTKGYKEQYFIDKAVEIDNIISHL